MATKTLSVVIAGDYKAGPAFSKLDDDADKSAGRLAKMGDKISPGLAAAAGAVVAGVGLMVKGAFDAADEAAKIGRETERVIQTTGASAWTSADQVADYAGELSELTGVDDELIQSGSNLLLTFTKIQNKVGEGNNVFDRATAAALDMSTALGTDIAGASVQVGKALNDPIKGITALSRAGVSFTAEQKDMIRGLVETGDVLGAQKIILQELEKEFGGAAEAAATPLDRLKVTVGNLQEQLGAYLIPVVGAVADALSSLTAGFAALPAPVQAVAGGIAAVGVAGSAGLVVVAKLADVFGGTLGPALRLGRELLDSAALGVANMATKVGVGQDSALKLASGISGVGAALPIVGAAALAGVTIWSLWSAEQEAAKKRADEFIKTLDEQSGALTENTTEATRSKLETNNRIDNLSQANVTVEAYTQAISDNSRALLDEKEVILTSNGFVNSGVEGRSKMVAKLREEGGARNELIATLLEAGAADEGLIKQIYEESAAYDKNQRTIENRADQQAVATGVTEEAARAEYEAAAAAREYTQSMKDQNDAQKALLDPLFGAIDALEGNRDAQAGATKAAQDAFLAQLDLNEAVKAHGPNSKEAREAQDALTEATEKASDANRSATESAMDVDQSLRTLSGAVKEGTVNVQDANATLQRWVQQGLITEQQAKDTGWMFLEMAVAAENANSKNVDIPVTTPGSERAIDQLSQIHQKMIAIANARGTTGQGFSSQDFAVPGSAAGGGLQEGLNIVGEAGPEWVWKSGATVDVYPNPKPVSGMAPMGGGNTIIINMPAGSNGEDVVDAIKRYEKRNGTGWRN